MIYSEASYFDGYHYQHIADWQEHQRLERIRREAQKLVQRADRRRGGRALFAGTPEKSLADVSERS